MFKEVGKYSCISFLDSYVDKKFWSGKLYFFDVTVTENVVVEGIINCSYHIAHNLSTFWSLDNCINLNSSNGLWNVLQKSCYWGKNWGKEIDATKFSEDISTFFYSNVFSLCVFLLEDNNGWSLQFDKHYTKDKYNQLKSLYAFQTKTPECCK